MCDVKTPVVYLVYTLHNLLVLGFRRKQLNLYIISLKLMFTVTDHQCSDRVKLFDVVGTLHTVSDCILFYFITYFILLILSQFKCMFINFVSNPLEIARAKRSRLMLKIDGRNSVGKRST